MADDTSQQTEQLPKRKERQRAGGNGTSDRFTTGDIIADRYRVVRFISSGGMADVFEVEDLFLHVRVALKTIRDSIRSTTTGRERFKREILLARSIGHPNVCRVYDLGVHKSGGESAFFLTMELLQGETLCERIRRAGRMSEHDAAPIVLQLTSALNAAHDAGILHRDFKSSNVILVPSKSGERAVITDFGLALLLEARGAEAARLTTTDKVVGTISYMAPEQLMGGTLGRETDIYALGMVLYEMLTGVLPNEGSTPIQMMATRLAQDPEPPKRRVPSLDPAWDSAIQKCLSRDPKKRFPRSSDVSVALGLAPPAPFVPSGESLASPSSGDSRPSPSLASSLPTEKVEGVCASPEILVSAAEAPSPRRRLVLLLVAAALGLVLTIVAVKVGWRGVAERLAAKDNAEERVPVAAKRHPEVRWTERSFMPTPRIGSCLVSLNGLIYAIGGFKGKPAAYEKTAIVEIYDPIRDSWRTATAMPTARGNAGVAALDGKIYVFGGRTDPWGELLDSVECYDPAQDSWTKLSPLIAPGARHLLAGAAGRSTVFVLGGYDSGCLNVVQEYDPLHKRWSNKAPMHLERELVSTVTLEGEIFALGGHQCNYPAYYAAVEAYDIAKNEWRRCADLPAASEACAVALNGRVYAVVDRKTYEYTPSDDAWIELSGDCIAGRTEFSKAAVAAQGRIYIIGGLINGRNTGLVEEAVVRR